MWWKLRQSGQYGSEAIAHYLVGVLKDPPVPVITVAAALKVKVTVGDYPEPRFSCSIVSRSAKIRLPKYLEKDVNRSRYFIALGLGSILNHEPFEERPSDFADALLVPAPLLEEYGPKADWDAAKLAKAFAVHTGVVNRRIAGLRSETLAPPPA